MRLYSVVSRTGQILGYLDGSQVPVREGKHGDVIGVPLMRDAQDKSYDVAEFRWHEIRFASDREVIGSVWHLVPENVPERVWHTRGFMRIVFDARR